MILNQSQSSDDELIEWCNAAENNCDTFTDLTSLRYEQQRLDTFADWTSENVSKYDLAANGFFYLKKLDHTACYFCCGILGAWQKSDDVVSEHKRHRPKCAFLNDSAPDNVPISSTCETINIPPPSLTYINTKPTIYIPSFKSRLSTFKNWPLKGNLDASKMALAGFVSIRLSDHTKCFYCNIGLRNWRSTAIPDIDHYIQSPNCRFAFIRYHLYLSSDRMRAFLTKELAAIDTFYVNI